MLKGSIQASAMLGVLVWLVAASAHAADSDKPVGELSGAEAFALGERFEHGDGVGPDEARAFRFYCEAAQKGYSAANYNLGWLYLNGRGVARDDARAGYWFQRASRKGDFQAQSLLRRLHLRPASRDKDCEVQDRKRRFPGNGALTLALADPAPEDGPRSAPEAAPAPRVSEPGQTGGQTGGLTDGPTRGSNPFASASAKPPAKPVSKPWPKPRPKPQPKPRPKPVTASSPAATASATSRPKPAQKTTTESKASSRTSPSSKTTAPKTTVRKTAGRTDAGQEDEIKPCIMRSDAVVAKQVDDGRYCVMVRHVRLADLDQLHSVTGRYFVELEETTVPFGSVYQLYLPADGDSAAAQARKRRLEQAGLADLAIIGSGPLKNAISLGAFQRSASVQRRRLELARMNLAAECRSVALKRPQQAYRLLGTERAIQRVLRALPAVASVAQSCR